LNFGQLNEIYYGEIAKRLGVKFAFPIFSKIDHEKIEELMKKHNLDNIDDKVMMRDGRSGELFENKISVGPRYILVLDHLADTKVTARSTGHYTVVNQQPLGGKAQMGGQRFGEMEVWALEAYGAAATLQEMLSIKSDDIIGRSEAYKSIIHNRKIQMIGIPESFKVLLLELKSLGLSIEPIEPIIVEDEKEERANIKVEDVLPEDVFIDIESTKEDEKVEKVEKLDIKEVVEEVSDSEN
jgi:DNA-directed RNA polymerase subunit beta